MKPVTLLVTAAGSLVGKVVLDALEGRRDGVRIVALNSTREVAHLQRADAVHVIPLTQAPEWRARVLDVMAHEQPDVVIPGRDEDVEALAHLAEAEPALARALLAGPAALAGALLDKRRTHAFGVRHGLAVAPTVATDGGSAGDEAAALLARVGFPLIAKPALGCGSQGVRVLTRPEHLAAALATPGFVVQPFLDPPDAGALSLPLEAGVPLFFEIPEDRLFAVQYVLGRDGAVLGRMAHRARMVRGRCEELWACDDPGLLAVGDAVARAAAAEGWRGPFNVQAKRAPDGGWQVIELNGRFSGGTSSRLYLGFDEVGMLVNHWVGREVVPPWRGVPVQRVVRQLADVPVPDGRGAGS